MQAQINFALMVGKMQSLFPSTRALICFATKRPHGQAVKTSPSHGGIWGSIPHGGTKKNTRYECFFIIHFYSSFIPRGICTLCVRNFVARTPEHWAGAHLLRVNSLGSLFHDSHGGTNENKSFTGLFFFFSWGIAHFVCVALLHEPQNTGVAFRYMSELTRYTISLTTFSTIPMGVPKNKSFPGLFSFSHGKFALFVCVALPHEPQNTENP